MMSTLDGKSHSSQDRVDARTELITPEPAEALAGLLDIDPPPSHPGAPLPWLWHWVYLLDRYRQSELGPDGHATNGMPTPPVPGWRRMFAGGRVSTYRPLRVGEPATRTSRVTSTVEKTGKSGRLVFMTVRSEIEQGGELAIVDERDIVYRAPTGAPGAALATNAEGGTAAGASTPASTPAAEAGPADTDTVLRFDVDPVVLFRFSALTYNAHRIHYDRPYALSEGYPDLVIHGPLQALLMGEVIRRTGVSTDGTLFSYRLLAPAFGAQQLAVTARKEESAVAAQVRDATGRITASATLTLERPQH